MRFEMESSELATVAIMMILVLCATYMWWIMLIGMGVADACQSR